MGQSGRMIFNMIPATPDDGNSPRRRRKRIMIVMNSTVG